MNTEEARMESEGGPALETTTEPAGTPARETTTGPVGTSALATTTEPTAGANTGAKTPDPVLADELREFGKQIEQLFHTARTSTRGQEIEAQLTSAWRDVEKGVNTAITKAQSSDLKGTVQGTAQYASDEVQSGLARGLKGLNQWLEQKRAEMEERRKTREAAEAAAAITVTTDNDVRDRFSGDAPVFGQDVHVPAPSQTINPDPPAMTQDNPVADRFQN